MLNQKSARDRHRVLVFDHDEANRQRLCDCLRAGGFQVTLASDHAEFCLKLLTSRPDVVLASAAARLRDTVSLARLIRGSARRPVPAVLICDLPPPVQVDATVVLRASLFAEVVGRLRAALAAGNEAPAPRGGLPRARLA